MVHFQQQSAHVRKTEYMNFPCDASKSPLSRRMGALKTHYWLAFPRGGNSLLQSGGLGTKLICGRAISAEICAGWKIFFSKNSPLKYCFFFLNSHLSVSVCRRMKECAQLGVSCAAAAARSRAVPQRPLFQKPGILFHKTWNGCIKKKSYYPFRQLSWWFRERNLRRRGSADKRNEPNTRWSSVFFFFLESNVYLCLYRSAIS